MSAALRKFHSTKISCVLARFTSSSGSAAAEKTSLYDFHVQRKGKVVNFAGYLLPVQYDDLSIANSHLHTRKHCSIFDVSHMLQTYVRGRNAIECFESVCTADIQGLADRTGCLTAFTNVSGGILDDLIVTRVSPELLYVVSNAACKAQDTAIMQEAVEDFKLRGKQVDVKFYDPSEKALLALQGPEAAKALQQLTQVDLKRFYFMNSIVARVLNVDCRITRCGYTGEDGFEISMPAGSAVEIAEALLDSTVASVKMAGLGARDSLRLEAGLCLYGSDIDSQTTPVEAGLAWLVAKRRRSEANFPGAEIINKQLKEGVSKRRVGFRMLNGPPARHESEIIVNDEKVGEITSGCPSPSLGGNVAMGYIREEFKKNGTKVDLKIRGKLYPAEVSKMPFVPSRYFQEPKGF